MNDEMTLYLSGPMTGIPEHNFPLFNAVAHKLRAANAIVYNPAEHFSGRVDLPRAEYMAEDFRKLLEVANADTPVKGIVLLPGWTGSKGARAEVVVAHELGLQFFAWQDERLQRTTLAETFTDTASAPLSIEEAQAALAYAVGKREYDNGSRHASATAAVYVDEAMKRLTTGEVRITDPKTGGQKGAKNIQFHTIPPEFLAEVGRVYSMGAKKYSARNFEKGYAWSLSFDAMMRHLWAWWGGEETDPESGCNHMAHGVWHCFQLMLLAKYHRDLDDRSDLYAKGRNLQA